MTDDHTETDAAAAEIASRFGETEPRPRAQLKRMSRLMGPGWMYLHAARAQGAIERGDAITRCRDGQPRTPGGVFFEVARATAAHLVLTGSLTKREFHRCFTDRVKKPRVPKPPVPTTCHACTEADANYVGPESVHRHDARVGWERPQAPTWPPAETKHTTRGGKGAVGRLTAQASPGNVRRHDKRSRTVPVEVIVRASRRGE